MAVRCQHQDVKKGQDSGTWQEEKQIEEGKARQEKKKKRISFEPAAGCARSRPETRGLHPVGALARPHRRKSSHSGGNLPRPSSQSRRTSPASGANVGGMTPGTPKVVDSAKHPRYPQVLDSTNQTEERRLGPWPAAPLAGCPWPAGHLVVPLAGCSLAGYSLGGCSLGGCSLDGWPALGWLLMVPWPAAPW